MEQCRDIRSEEVYNDSINTSLCLLRQWPQYPGAPASGIACLTVVLRAIYARLPKESAQQMRHLESENPLLRHAWLTFAGIPEKDHESALNQLAVDLWGKPFSEVDQGTQAAFESLINSEYRHVLLRPAAPSFIYMTVSVCNTRKHDLALDEIYTLSLDCGRFETVDGGVIWKEKAETIRYTLAALVQYRRTPDGCDHVQLLDSLGHKIRPLHAPGQYFGERASFSPGAKLFLLFAQNDYDPPKSSTKAKGPEPRASIRNRVQLQRTLDRGSKIR